MRTLLDEILSQNYEEQEIVSPIWPIKTPAYLEQYPNPLLEKKELFLLKSKAGMTQPAM